MITEQQFIQAITEHQGIIHKVCNLYLADQLEKEDLLQEILLNAWKGCKNFKGEAKFSTWLYRVALNTAIAFYRKDKRRVNTTPLPEQAVNQTPYTSEHKEQVDAMYRAIGTLSRIDKAIVMLYLEDYDYQEIGDITGITANHVAVKMNRIKAKLRETSKKLLFT